MAIYFIICNGFIYLLDCWYNSCRTVMLAARPVDTGFNVFF